MNSYKKQIMAVEKLSPDHSYYERFQSITLHDLQLEGVPEHIDYAGELYGRKGEFHVTIMSIKRTAARIDPSRTEQLTRELIALFKSYIAKNPLNNWHLLGEYRLVEDIGTKTIVTMAEVEGLKELFETIGDHYGVDIPMQPAHITLATQDNHPGIPVNTPTQLEEISKVISLDFEATAA